MDRSFNIVIPDTLSAAGKRLAVELALLLGYRSISLQFPVAVAEAGHSRYGIRLHEDPALPAWQVDDGWLTLNCTQDAPENLYRRVLTEFASCFPDYEEQPHHRLPQEGFASASRLAKPLPPFDTRKHKGLEALFDKDFIFQDRDHDLLSDAIAAKILLPEEASHAQVLACANLAARLGLETLGICYPMVSAQDDGQSNLFTVAAGELEQLAIQEEAGRQIITLSGRDAQLEAFTARLLNRFPLTDQNGCLDDVIDHIREALAMKNLDGQVAYLQALGQQGKGARCYFSPAVRDKLQQLSQDFPGVDFQSYLDYVEVTSKTYDVPWEVDVFRHKMQQLIDSLHEGDQVEISAALSEDKQMRDALGQEMAAAIAQKGAQLVSWQMICVYKQGLSWLSEVIGPQIAELGPQFGKLVVAFKPFLEPGVTEWNDIPGAVPTYHLEINNEKAPWFDLPIRYLQELYPIDDVLAHDLGISRDQVEFVEYKGDEDITYEARIYDQDEQPLLCATHKVYNNERPLLAEFPSVGIVHANCGYLKVKINGQSVCDERIKTDLESIWDIYQNDTLPYFGNYIKEQSGGKPDTSLQPYFAEMLLEVRASEPEYMYDFRETIISSLNSGHEDMYYVGLEYFKCLGLFTSGEALDAPGLIMPKLIAAPGKPYFKMTHYNQAAHDPTIEYAGGKITRPLAKQDIQAWVDAVTWNGDRLCLHIGVEGSGLAAPVAGLAATCGKGYGELAGYLGAYDQIDFRIDGQTYTAPLAHCQAEPLPPLDIREIDLMEDKVIGYDRYMQIIEQLKRVPGIRVFKAGESYLGRAIYAIELEHGRPGYTSLTKLINLNPSFYINNRHHANEISATNCSFLVIRELLTNPRYADLGQKINLVIVPFENADGAEIHYILQQDNPQWTLHGARYSAIGREFYYEHFKEDTIHVEAKPLTKLWRKWLPDVLTDNHGVSKNENDQPFFGYVHPSFRGFWLPRSLLYGYFWHIANPEYAMNIPLNKVYEDVVADVFEADDEITALNLEWQNRFEKYAHKWMPKLFPADYYRNMINYWIPYEYDAGHRYTSIRFPWITTVNYTSEIADETAQGEYLALCARTHALHNVAAIEMLMNCGCVYAESLDEESGHICSSCIRQRPIVCG